MDSIDDAKMTSTDQNMKDFTDGINLMVLTDEINLMVLTDGVKTTLEETHMLMDSVQGSKDMIDLVI